MEVKITPQTAVVDEPEAWHTVSDAHLRRSNKVHVEYLRVSVSRVTIPYTNAERYNFNADKNGGLYGIPEAIPAEVLAEASKTVVEHIEANK